MEKNARIYVAGQDTLIGSAMLRTLARHRFTHVIDVRDSEPDLTDPAAIQAFFERTDPEYVFLVAGKSAGIAGNQRYPADLIRENLLVECQVIHAAHRHGVKKLLYVASSCCYPRNCPQPMRVESLMTGRLEPTSEAYAVAKLAGIALCQAYAHQHGARFISGIAADAFGVGDDFSPEDSHVVPALIRRMHEARLSGAPAVDIWGTGQARRECIFADDLADACVFVMQRYEDTRPINLGGGTDVSIRELAALVREVVGYQGDLRYDATRPDGMPAKVLDSSSLLSMGWRPTHSLHEALALTYEAFDGARGTAERVATLTSPPVDAGRTELYKRFFRALYRIRRAEEEVARIYPTDRIKSPVHLSIGQEAVSVGVCEALRPTDVVFGTYRGHALYLAKGGDLKRMIAELYGKVTGCAKGKGGSMHLIDVHAGMSGTSAVVGTTIPHAVGYAYVMKMQRKGGVAASFFGDGAVDEGAFHESMNFAALKQLPIIFVCENNQYSIHSHQLTRQPLANIRDRARAYGMPATTIDDGDVLKVYDYAQKAANAMRTNGSGPWFLECMTYRWKEHVGPSEDFQAGYRPQSEAEPWYEGDQVRRVGGMLGPDTRQQIVADVEAEIREAFAFAEASPFPEDVELYTDVFKEV